MRFGSLQFRAALAITGLFCLLVLPVVHVWDKDAQLCAEEKATPKVDPQLVTLVESDWEKQEARLGRRCDSVEAMKAALRRIEYFAPQRSVVNLRCASFGVMLKCLARRSTSRFVRRMRG